MTNILIIDDDQMVCDILSTFFQSLGYEVNQTYTLAKGIQMISNGSFDLILLDVRLPDGNGLDQITLFRGVSSSPEVIIITGEGSPDGARLAMENGAWDYLQKPLSMEKVRLSISRAIQYHQERIASSVRSVLQRDDIIGRSQTIRSSLEQVARSSQSNASVLITGESGTGKELFARAVHNNSSRASQPFVVVDCASLTETLAESVLFGHTRGAFTGAEKARDGLIRMANQGTLFLDEVGELPLTIQSSFLRVLQEHRFRPLGGGQEISSDFRVVAATNRRLAEMVQQGRFRSDLLFRLKSLTIHLPPLRERHGDIAELTLHFIDKICRQHNTGVKGMSPEFIMALGEYAWPGNVRELVNTLESAVVSAMDFPTLYPIHLPAEIRSKVAQVLFDFPREAQADHSLSGVSFPPLRELITSVEKKYLSDLISHTGGNIREVCRISGISRANIYARLRKYGIMRQFSL